MENEKDKAHEKDLSHERTEEREGVVEEELLSDEEMSELKRRFEEFDVEKNEPEVIDVSLESLDPELQEKVRGLEQEFNDRLDEQRAESAKTRLNFLSELAEKISGSVSDKTKERTKEGALALAKVFDVDTKEKAMSALLEIIPYVGAVYAVTGRRVVFEKGKGAVPGMKLESLTWTDRGLYLAGELLVSGHVLRGVKDAVFQRGATQVAKEIGKAFALKTQEVLVKRATLKAEQKLIDRKES